MGDAVGCRMGDASRDGKAIGEWGGGEEVGGERVYSTYVMRYVQHKCAMRVTMELISSRESRLSPFLSARRQNRSMSPVVVMGTPDGLSCWCVAASEYPSQRECYS